MATLLGIQALRYLKTAQAAKLRGPEKTTAVAVDIKPFQDSLAEHLYHFSSQSALASTKVAVHADGELSVDFSMEMLRDIMMLLDIIRVAGVDIPCGQKGASPADEPLLCRIDADVKIFQDSPSTLSMIDYFNKMDAAVEGRNQWLSLLKWQQGIGPDGQPRGSGFIMDLALRSSSDALVRGITLMQAALNMENRRQRFMAEDMIKAIPTEKLAYESAVPSLRLDELFTDPHLAKEAVLAAANRAGIKERWSQRLLSDINSLSRIYQLEQEHTTALDWLRYAAIGYSLTQRASIWEQLFDLTKAAFPLSATLVTPMVMEDSESRTVRDTGFLALATRSGSGSRTPPARKPVRLEPLRGQTPSSRNEGQLSLTGSGVDPSSRGAASTSLGTRGTTSRTATLAPLDIAVTERARALASTDATLEETQMRFRAANQRLFSFVSADLNANGGLAGPDIPLVAMVTATKLGARTRQSVAAWRFQIPPAEDREAAQLQLKNKHFELQRRGRTLPLVAFGRLGRTVICQHEGNYENVYGVKLMKQSELEEVLRNIILAAAPETHADNVDALIKRLLASKISESNIQQMLQDGITAFPQGGDLQAGLARTGLTLTAVSFANAVFSEEYDTLAQANRMEGIQNQFPTPLAIGTMDGTTHASLTRLIDEGMKTEMERISSRESEPAASPLTVATWPPAFFVYRAPHRYFQYIDRTGYHGISRRERPEGSAPLPDRPSTEISEAWANYFHQSLGLLKHGIGLYGMIGLTHTDTRGYNWMIGFMRLFYGGSNQGMGKIANWKKGVRYSDIRMSGVADLGDHKKLGLPTDSQLGVYARYWDCPETDGNDNDLTQNAAGIYIACEALYRGQRRITSPEERAKLFLVQYFGNYLFNAFLVHCYRALMVEERATYTTPSKFKSELLLLFRTGFRSFLSAFGGTVVNQILPDQAKQDRFVEALIGTDLDILVNQIKFFLGQPGSQGGSPGIRNAATDTNGFVDMGDILPESYMLKPDFGMRPIQLVDPKTGTMNQQSKASPGRSALGNFGLYGDMTQEDEEALHVKYPSTPKRRDAIRLLRNKLAKQVDIGFVNGPIALAHLELVLYKLVGYAIFFTADAPVAPRESEGVASAARFRRLRSGPGLFAQGKQTPLTASETRDAVMQMAASELVDDFGMPVTDPRDASPDDFDAMERILNPGL